MNPRDPLDAGAEGAVPDQVGLAELAAELRRLQQVVEAGTATASSSNARRPGVPTLRAYLPRALDLLEPGNRRTFGSPLQRLLEFQPCLADEQLRPGDGIDCARLGCETQHVPLGDVALDRIEHSDLEAFAAEVQRKHRARELLKLRDRMVAEARADGRHLEPQDVVLEDRDLERWVGASGREGAISAMRWLFAKARRDWLKTSPAEELEKPKRTRTARRAFSEPELPQVVAVALSTACDADLVRLLLQFHLTTGARQGEALRLRLSHVDLDRQTIWLGEKGGRPEEQPVPLSLLVNLMEFALSRDACAGDDRVFRNRRGQAVSKKAHERIWAEVRGQLRFAELMSASTHCLRKTAGTIVERHAGTAVSERFLRHSAPTLNGIYTGATLDEVAQAVADLTGEPHPLAARPPAHVVGSLLLPG